MNILDIAQNSVRAGASLTGITLTVDDAADRLTLVIQDNGCGMDAGMVQRVIDPFYTSRTTRKVGLGIPFLKMAAEMTGGSLSIDSTPGVGTTVTANFSIQNIDRMPLGDLAGTMTALMQCNPDIDFIFTLRRKDELFVADSREMKVILESVPISNPQVALFLQEFIEENIKPILEKEPVIL